MGSIKLSVCFNLHRNIGFNPHFCQWRPHSSVRNGSCSVASQYKRRSSTSSSSEEAKCKSSTPQPCLKKVLVPIGAGTEEMEAVIIIDVLRRAGAHVTVASVERDLQIKASLQVNIIADTLISSCGQETFDLVVLPGGMPGSARLRDSEILKTITRKQAEAGRLYGAISAAPVIALDAWGLLTAVEVTVHPAFSWKLSSFWTVTSNVHRDKLLTTSRGPGTAMEFALSLVEQLFGKEKSEEIEKTLVTKNNDGNGSKREEYNAVDWEVKTIPRRLPHMSKTTKKQTAGDGSKGQSEKDNCASVDQKKPSPSANQELLSNGIQQVANGSEEMEAVIVIDILRRAKANVVVASIEETLEVVGSRNVKFVADKLIEDAASSEYDLIILPGGMPGAKRLQKSVSLRKLLREQALSNRIYGAICASPVVVLETHGLLKGKKATAYPSFSGKLLDQGAVNAQVVIDGKLITSRGPGTAIEFSLAMVDKLYGKERAKNVSKGIVYDYS
ncbi:protein DJ-1 homolog B isoform X1 [Cryptomeria japonica]|uniref:protein DJ-1 homolog B isoform X1 n=1 Tax=Cryptomeria japonica TaxID=3369 RepID=UPI0027DA3F31|nr:protein DJ-1 homolog B isoform X1 [Cryptomeria japonica]